MFFHALSKASYDGATNHKNVPGILSVLPLVVLRGDAYLAGWWQRVKLADSELELEA